MIVPWVCLIVLLVFVLGGALAWVLARILKIRGAGRKIFRTTLYSFLTFLPVFVFLVSPMIVSYLVANASTRPRDQQLVDTPANYGAQFSEVEFAARDGVRVRGWLLPGEEGKPTLVLGHGLFRNRREVLQRGCALNQHGYPVLLFDFRGHGSSGRSAVSLGFKERLDVLAAYDYLKEAGAKQFVLMGVSMGSVAAIHAAVDCGQDLKAIVADSPFENLRETVSLHTALILKLPAFPFADLFVWNLSRIGDFQAAELDTTQALQKTARVPVLLIYGADDRRMPETTARRIFDSVVHQQKKIVFFEDAGHGAAFRTDPDRYVETIVEFLTN